MLTGDSGLREVGADLIRMKGCDIARAKNPSGGMGVRRPSPCGAWAESGACLGLASQTLT